MWVSVIIQRLPTVKVMNFFRTKDFFELSSFVHSSLFEEDQPVWFALKRIQIYLESSKLGIIEGNVDKNAYLIHPELISIGPGSIVEPGAYIKGPCIIGADCEIRQGAYIRGHVIVGDRCVVGHATEVKHSIFLNDAHAGHFAYVGDSILGNRVNLGAGVKCANLRLDKKNVPISFGDKRLDTGLRKLGAIIGDDAQLGCNCVTNPGTLMGKKSCCYPCLAIQGFIPEDSLIKKVCDACQR